MKNILLTAFIAVFLCLSSGCSTVQKLNDFVRDNSLLVSDTARIVTAKLIENGKPGGEIIERVSRVKSFISTTAAVTTSTAMQFLNAQIPWEKLAYSDKLLVQRLLTMINEDLLANEDSEPNQLVNLVELLDVVIETAQFLEG